MLPTALASDLELALRAVQAHPAHVLDPGYRWLIWEHMGARGTETTPWTDVGHRRRTLLAIASARLALPLWETRWPQHREPPAALAAAIDYLDGHRPADACWRILDRARETVNEVITEDFALSYAGESMIEVLRAALDDEYFEPGVRELDWVDGQMDGDDNDAASTAAIALGNGTALNPRSDPAKRLAFWEWWLREAVPAAYRDGTSTPGRRGAEHRPGR